MSELPVDWVTTLIQRLRSEESIVRVVLAEVRGSAPREPGASMLVGVTQVQGTIGGGQLEWEAIAAARGLLELNAVPSVVRRVVLGADVGQCCGGVVTLRLQRYTVADVAQLQAARPLATAQLRRPTLWLYGAGHVGQALARIVAELPPALTWIDSRENVFPAVVSDSVRTLHCADPVASVADAPADCYFVVMTHSHSLDYELCRAILRRRDFAWVGLIGSMSKAARFRSRLARDATDPGAIARLICPIGIGGITSKWPAAIAVSVAAQLMQALGSVEADLRRSVAVNEQGSHACKPGGCEHCVATSAIPCDVIPR